MSEVTGLRRPCHMTVRRDTLSCGQQLEDAQFLAGWYAGQRRRRGRAQQLRVAIDGTYLTAAPEEEVTKFEVVAGRVERDGGMGRRFACALSRRSMTRTLVAAALEQSGWAPQTEVEVMSDGAKGMRSLVASVAPTLSKPTLDWFHLAMKIHAVRTALGACAITPNRRPAFMTRSARTGSKIRDLLWRGRTEEALDLTRTLITSLQAEAPNAPALLCLGGRDGARRCHQAVGVREEEPGGHHRLQPGATRRSADLLGGGRIRHEPRHQSPNVKGAADALVDQRRAMPAANSRVRCSTTACKRTSTHEFPHFRSPEVRHA